MMFLDKFYGYLQFKVGISLNPMQGNLIDLCNIWLNLKFRGCSVLCKTWLKIMVPENLIYKNLARIS
jgi:hypothetical protein